MNISELSKPQSKPQRSIITVDRLRVAELPKEAMTSLRVAMVHDAMGRPLHMPVIVARGATDGPVVGLTAAMHGNELNGVRIVHRLLADLDLSELSGTIVAVPVVNIPGYLMNLREFNDGIDLNRVMPGRPNGNSSDVYAHRFMERVVSQFEYLIDLHTASFGRVNSLYVRANLTNPNTAWMARAQHAQIIVHNCARDGTLRDAAMELGIPAITVEVGDPQRFQRRMIRFGMVGVSNVLARLGMVPAEDEDDPEAEEHEPVVCARSYWIHTDMGGLLDVYPELGAHVAKGDLLARVISIYGDTLREYHAPEDGIVVGKSTNPVNQTGARIIHFGVIATPQDGLAPHDESTRSK